MSEPIGRRALALATTAMRRAKEAEGVEGPAGPAGPEGPPGPPGSDANVTNANVNAAISADPSATKTALALAKADVGLGSVDNTADSVKNVLSATKLTTARSISVTGDLTWSVNFDGSTNVSAAGTLATVNSNTGTYGGLATVPQISVDGKGRITGVTAVGIEAPWAGISGKPAAVTALSGTNTGDQTITLTGDITGSGTGSFAATLGANVVTDAKFRQSAGLSVVGRSASTTGNVADMTAGTDGHVLRRSGTSLGFGTIATGGITDNAVTLAKLAQVATASFLGRTTAGTGNVEALTATQATALLNTATSTLKGLMPPSVTTKTAFTPRLAIGGSSTDITYTAQNGFYTKVGDTVTVSIRLILSSKGSASGAVTIEDLPFAVGANGAAPVLILGSATTTLPTCLPSNTTTSILLYAATFSQLAASDITNSTSFYVTATYLV